MNLSAIIRRENQGFESLYLEPDVASQVDAAGEVRSNLKEALDLYLNVRP